MRSTTITKPADVKRTWWVVDAEGKTLGRLASEIAKILRGKHKPTFQPHVDTGDYVIVINAEKVHTTGNKLEQKLYFSHSGWVGGDKLVSLKTMMARKPTNVLSHAVRGMLPKNTLGRRIFRKLHVYAGPEHKHQAQQPQPLEL